MPLDILQSAGWYRMQRPNFFQNGSVQRFIINRYHQSINLLLGINGFLRFPFYVNELNGTQSIYTTTKT